MMFGLRRTISVAIDLDTVGKKTCSKMIYSIVLRH